MKYERTPAFDRDLARLGPVQEQLFRRVVREQFAPAAERVASNPAARWPASLRVKLMRGAPGIWEMTWSFSGPDGRATFEWVEIDGEPAIRWRRVGDHGVFARP